MPERLRIGELAERSGLTVRTLHHYDEIGLLTPSERTDAGHRIYTAGDVQRLYRIVALKQLGLPLAEIGELLERNGADPRPVVRRHLERLERMLRLQERLRDRLTSILDELAESRAPSTDDFMDALEVMSKMDRYYTPEQLADLEERRKQLGEEGMLEAQADWAELIAEVEAERARGTDPADPRMGELVTRWKALIEAFTGGDPGIRDSLQRMYDEQGPETASRGMVSSDAMAFMQRAMVAAEEGR